MTLRSRAAAVLAVLALVLPAGCGGGDSENTAAAQATSVARDLASYDAFVLASAENNPLFADVYGLRFDPLVVERITVNKRVSSLAADDERVLVAAADQDVDRPAQVTDTGELIPIPGLGRPFAYSPYVLDGVMFYNDAQGEGKKGKFRYWAWDLGKRQKSLLFQSGDSLGGAHPLGAGRFMVRVAPDSQGDRLAVRSRSGKLTEFGLGGNVSDVLPGRDHFAATLVGEGDRFGDTPESLVLVDAKSGERQRVPGLQVVAGNPDGTRLLARRIAAAGQSQLVLLDPANPAALSEIGTVADLTVYTGTWVRGGLAAAS
ncbi:MAG: hypothetical protein ACT4QG_10365 [Sporichthyaceae bacterium]